MVEKKWMNDIKNPLERDRDTLRRESGFNRLSNLLYV